MDEVERGGEGNVDILAFLFVLAIVGLALLLLLLLLLLLGSGFDMVLSRLSFGLVFSIEELILFFMVLFSLG